MKELLAHKFEEIVGKNRPSSKSWHRWSLSSFPDVFEWYLESIQQFRSVSDDQNLSSMAGDFFHKSPSWPDGRMPPEITKRIFEITWRIIPVSDPFSWQQKMATIPNDPGSIWDDSPSSSSKKIQGLPPQIPWVLGAWTKKPSKAEGRLSNQGPFGFPLASRSSRSM